MTFWTLDTWFSYLSSNLNSNGLGHSRKCVCCPVNQDRVNSTTPANPHCSRLKPKSTTCLFFLATMGSLVLFYHLDVSWLGLQNFAHSARVGLVPWPFEGTHTHTFPNLTERQEKLENSIPRALWTISPAGTLGVAILHFFSVASVWGWQNCQSPFGNLMYT